ncbi:hypothetical protein CcaverHIS002_0304270 [Cutaneotrichosporon cavernicola]|uniref:Uncharacterized protein n=1 Tax=Cutaneotrichosporon cavernicola TaxID=279322 RepID=A0AA48I337_9TREE|nr:uncharacterized protein CcaverHIS019_0304240 [Cutaneotrichosporon cavernicola]BEI82559.1 hypothetical protein CcaverHIS002_0304270 [Cutaneotrichosporon cavernicola]BEI90354.1 hypothetical protein CcaverHIS019_0304240 [Cutaneotrichosporon cavernicola]BEI98130.1 hypothetical protein CcaverHIS631_0304290 [Cutaneotrichosporon cavernicola]BEJ05907.1 hypothetical protein CcaverHIS641_0304290 [Cutaneotrichosporon cavernicola]
MLNRDPSPYFPGSESRDDLHASNSLSAPSPKAMRKPSPFASEAELRHSFTIPMISVTHAENDYEGDDPLSSMETKTKATEARAVVESVQTVLEENIAGIDESPPSLTSRRRGRPLQPWYRKKWVILGAAGVLIAIAIIVLVVVIVVETR